MNLKIITPSERSLKLYDSICMKYPETTNLERWNVDELLPGAGNGNGA